MENKWILPHKQIILETGLLVIHENAVDYENASLHVVKIDGSCHFLMGEAHLILLYPGVLECLEKTRRVYLAYCEKNDLAVYVQWHTDIDDMAMGKLIAYLEISEAETPMTAQ